MKGRRQVVAHQQALVDYVLGLSNVRRKDVRFVILDGSTAEGKDRRYSDYDISVVKKGSSGPKGPVKDLFAPTGLFRGRMVTGWLLDDESFKHRYLGDDDEQFAWRRRQLRKARLLYGNKREFGRIIRGALGRRWNRKRQVAVITHSYANMAEYMGKMLNKVEAHEDNVPEFYQDGYIIAANFATLAAALNRIDLDSDKTMYRQILAEARVKPPHFGRDFGTVSGLSGKPRSRRAVLSASRRLLRWARRKVLELESPSFGDHGFRKMVQEITF